MTTGLWALAIVACGLGATVRYLVARLDPEAPFPWTTLVSNTVGCAVLGAAAAAVEGGAPASILVVVGTGFAGGLTTFSTLAVDAVVLHVQRRRSWFWGYLAGTMVTGLAGAFAGYTVWTGVAS